MPKNDALIADAVRIAKYPRTSVERYDENWFIRQVDERYKNAVEIGDNDICRRNVRPEQKNKRRAYNLLNITKAPVSAARVQGNAPSPVMQNTSAIKNVSDLFGFVKSYDKGFSPKDISSEFLNQADEPFLHVRSILGNAVFSEENMGTCTREIPVSGKIRVVINFDHHKGSFSIHG